MSTKTKRNVRRWRDLPRFHNFRCALLAYERMTKVKNPRGFDVVTIEKLLKKYAPSTQKAYRQGLRFYFESRAKSPFEKWKVTEEFKHIRIATPARALDKRKYATLEELERIAAACSPRMSLIILGLFWTACRISEYINIRLGDCTIEGTKVRIIVRGKTGERVCFMPLSVYESTRRTLSGPVYLVEQRGGGPMTRGTVGGEMRAQTSRVRSIHPHLLRHSRAMDLITRGTPIDAISRYLGHSDVGTTCRYYLHSSFPSDKRQGLARAEESMDRIDKHRRYTTHGKATWRRRQ